MTPAYLHDDELDPDNNLESSGLSKLNKDNPFKVPDGYFESLSENIQKKIDALPDLERMNKENPFRVPDGYFDSLPTIIQQRILDEKNRQPVFGKLISIVFRPKFAMAVAATVLLVIFGIKYLTSPVLVEIPDNYLSYDEVGNSSYMNDLDEYLLVDVLEQESINSGKADDGIEQYLIDNNFDISQLENHL